MEYVLKDQTEHDKIVRLNVKVANGEKGDELPDKVARRTILNRKLIQKHRS